jgi:hypothetical protein
MELFIKDNLQKIKDMDWENFNLRLGKFMKVNFVKIRLKVWELKFVKIRHILEISIKGYKMEKEKYIFF